MSKLIITYLRTVSTDEFCRYREIHSQKNKQHSKGEKQNKFLILFRSLLSNAEMRILHDVVYLFASATVVRSFALSNVKYLNLFFRKK